MNIGGGQTVKVMPTPSSSVTWKAGDGVSDQFPAGLRVLVVDDDPTCLRILEQMLRNCLYEVTKCNRAEFALSLLRENKSGYDIVISDVHMPDMDGFKLLERVGLEMDLPVIMMSADDSKHVVMKGVTHGACDYLIKPVRIEALKNIWQHVVRKKKHEWKDKEFEQSGSVEDGDHLQKVSDDVDCSSSANEGNWKNSKKRKDEEEEGEEKEDTSTLKKPRVVWSAELHQQFVAAVNQLGIDKAVPKRILELMNVPGLTRENVASHLQKYRIYLRRVSGVPPHQSVLNNPFMGPPEATFGSMSSLNGLDLQTLAASGQLSAQSLATLQAAGLGRPTSKSGMSMPLLDQRNIFSFENPKSRFGEGQQFSNNNKQINLLHGIPTNMETKPLAGLHSGQPFAGMNVNAQMTQGSSLLMQMSQSQSRTPLLNDMNGNQVPRGQSSMAQAMLSNSVSGGVLAPKGGVENVRGMVYSSAPQTSPLVDFSMNQNSELPSNSFPFTSNSSMSSFTSKGLPQEEVNLETKGSGSFIPGYDLFSELHQQKLQDWGLQNVRSTFDVSQQSTVQGMDVPHSVLVQQGFSSGQKSGQNTRLPVGKAVFSIGESGQNTSLNMGQQPHPFIADNSFRVKSEILTDSNGHNSVFQEQFGQEDLMSALLKQHEGVGPSDHDFGFDGYSLDNLPV